MGLLDKLFTKIIDSPTSNKLVDAIGRGQDKIAEKLDELIPSSRIVRGNPEEVENPNCEYSVDRFKSEEVCYLRCINLLNRKPICQRKCESNAIVWTGKRMVIDTNKCSNCGRCGNACLHFVIQHNGETMGVTLGKTTRLLAQGTLRGLGLPPWLVP